MMTLAREIIRASHDEAKMMQSHRLPDTDVMRGQHPCP